MEIVRNVFYDGQFEGAYRLYKKDNKYFWEYVNLSYDFENMCIKEAFKNFPTLHIKKKRGWEKPIGSRWNIAGDIPYEEGDLE